MTTLISPIANRVLRELDSDGLKSLVASIGIPPRPSLLADMQDELLRADPRLRRVSDIAGSDVALSAALLKVSNSPMLGLSRRAETVEQAFMLLGFAQCQAIFIELVLRKVLPTTGPAMTRFWDVSAKRARAMTYLARAKKIVAPALAHTYGLFLDIGIPILMQRYPGRDGYLATLGRANASDKPFTEIEQEEIGTDHTLVGAIAARTWCVSQTAVLAVRLHHEYGAWSGPLPPEVGDLLGLGLVCDHIIQRYQGLNCHLEWEKGGTAALKLLGLSPESMDEWTAEVHEQFNATGV